MIVLGLDSSAVAASCAVVDTGTGGLLAYGGVNVRITHSQTLLPLVESVLSVSGIGGTENIDGFAVTNGPGSFTGLRIAVSTVKGLSFAFAESKPVCGVSTLLSLAYNLVGQNCTACCVMDARRQQVYNALFKVSGNVVTRLTPDRAVSLEELSAELEKYDDVVIVGDGAKLTYDYFGGKVGVAPHALRNQSAVSVCYAVSHGENAFITAKELMPKYIRESQAERELKKGIK